MLEYSSTIKKASISEYSFMSCLNQLQLLSSESESDSWESSSTDMLFVKNHFYQKLNTTSNRSESISIDFAFGKEQNINQIYDLRQVLIVLYFLSSSSVEEKAKHICQLFSHIPAASISNKIQPQARLRSTKEIRVIVGTLVEVSLIILPNFAGQVCL